MAESVEDQTPMGELNEKELNVEDTLSLVNEVNESLMEKIMNDPMFDKLGMQANTESCEDMQIEKPS